GTEVCNKVLGIIGLGNIGTIVAERAVGLRMKVIAYDPFVTPEAAARLRVELVPLDQLFPRADFITIHTPLTAETRGLVGRESIARMKRGGGIINCAPGGLAGGGGAGGGSQRPPGAARPRGPRGRPRSATGRSRAPRSTSSSRSRRR